MKKLWSLLSILFFATAVFGAAVPTTGIITTNNCSTIPNPVTFQTWCGLSTNGQIYVYNGSGYTQITGQAGGTVTNANPLTANLPVIGAGSNAVDVGTRTGNTTQYATSTGSHTSGNCAEWDASGNIVQSSGACGIAGSGYGTIQEEGSNLTGRTTMNFIGAGVTAADDAGNSRTNITIPGGATLAQGTLAGRGGASGSGLAEEITLGTNLSFSGTTLNATGGGSSGLTLVEHKTITANATSVTFSSLDGNTDGVYRLVVKVLNNAASLTTYRLKPNGLTSNLYGQQQYVASSGGNAWGALDTGTVNPAFISNGASLWVTGTVDIYARKNAHSIAAPMLYTGFASSGDGSSMLLHLVGGIWTDTSTNLTSLEYLASQANGIGDGSEFWLYKYAQ